jgi:penicillin amidase
MPHLLKLQGKTGLEKAALEMLRTWDCVLAPDSVGAAIYMTTYNKLERIVLSVLLGDDETLLHNYLGAGATLLSVLNGYASRSKPLLIRLLNERDDHWFADTAIPNGPTSWGTALDAALTAAVEELREQLGTDISRWQYGKIHRMTYSHALGAIKPLRKFFNRGPFPVGGDADTVNVGVTLPTQPQEVTTVPSYRQIINLADLTTSLSSHAPGQSGHPISKHYDDFINMALTVSHHPMLYEREMIEAQKEETLHMRPDSR